MLTFTKYTKKEIILKEAKGKKVLNQQGKTEQVHSRSVHRNLAGEKGVAWYIQLGDCEKYAAKNSLTSKAFTQNKRRDKQFPRQTKTKGVHDH